MYQQNQKKFNIYIRIYLFSNYLLNIFLFPRKKRKRERKWYQSTRDKIIDNVSVELEEMKFKYIHVYPSSIKYFSIPSKKKERKKKRKWYQSTIRDTKIIDRYVHANVSLELEETKFKYIHMYLSFQ